MKKVSILSNAPNVQSRERICRRPSTPFANPSAPYDYERDEDDSARGYCSGSEHSLDPLENSSCSTTANTYSASIAETEEDFENIEADYAIRSGAQVGNGDVAVKSAITRSQFPGFGHDTLHFPRDGEKVAPLSKSLAVGLKWKISNGAPRVVQKALKSVGFEFVTKGDQWIAYWGKHLLVDKFKKFNSWQYINHFPYSYEIGRKDKMWINYNAMRLAHGATKINHVPETYLLPRNRSNLDRVFSTSPAWILKPPASARGIGIKIITKTSSLPLPTKRKEAIVSRYIGNPLLINQRKFDLRLYVLVTSFEPLKIYLYDHGLARFASEPYTKMNGGRKSSYRYSHLTNYSINKKNDKGNGPINNQGIFGEGSEFSMTENKWSLETLKLYFANQGLDFSTIQTQIDSIIVKTVMSASTQNVSGTRMYKTGCYELFGYDILIDTKLKAWLMECNISPALKGSCDMDYKLKSGLVVDVFNLVGIKIEDVEKCRDYIRKKKIVEGVNTFSGPASDHRKHRSVFANKTGKSNILDNLTSHDIKVLVQAEEEMFRKGSFRRLWPSKNLSDHAQFMPFFNYFDRLLYEWTLTSTSHQWRCSVLQEKIREYTDSSVSEKKQIKSASTLISKPSVLNQKILDRMSNLTLVNSSSSIYTSSSSARFGRVDHNIANLEPNNRANTKSTTLSQLQQSHNQLRALNLSTGIMQYHPRRLG